MKNYEKREYIFHFAMMHEVVSMSLGVLSNKKYVPEGIYSVSIGIS
jgi:hypothetical protein